MKRIFKACSPLFPFNAVGQAGKVMLRMQIFLKVFCYDSLLWLIFSGLINNQITRDGQSLICPFSFPSDTQNVVNTSRNSPNFRSLIFVLKPMCAGRCCFLKLRQNNYGTARIISLRFLNTDFAQYHTSQNI